MDSLAKRLCKWLTRRQAAPVSLKRLEGIKTEIGNQLLDTLKAEGWEQIAQYSPEAFGKGIDYDFYRLRKNGQVLKLEWDNWMEWTLSGPAEQLTEIAQRFALRG